MSPITTTAPSLPFDVSPTDADHPALPPLARTRPPAIALPLPGAALLTTARLRKAGKQARAVERTLSMFAPEETPAVEPAPPAPAPPRVYTRQATLRTFAEAPAQLALTPALDRDTGHDDAFEREWAERHGLTESKPRRHLRLVRDASTPEGTCPDDTSACPHTTCRGHLGAVRELRGQSFACSVTVARTFGDLTDAEVAHVAGEDESFVQSTWMTFVRRNPVVASWLWSLVYDHAPELRSYVRPEWFDPELLSGVLRLGTGAPRRFTFGRKPGPQPRLRRTG